jgi:hypothetical protein
MQGGRAGGYARRSPLAIRPKALSRGAHGYLNRSLRRFDAISVAIVEIQITIADPALRGAPLLSLIASEVNRFEPAGIEGVVHILQAELKGEVCLEFLGKDGTYLPKQGKLVTLPAPMLQEAGTSILPTVRGFLQSIIATYELERMRNKRGGFAGP